MIAAAGLAALGIALYRAPTWWDSWNTLAVVGMVMAAATILVAAIALALRGSARAVQRVTVEASFFVCALLTAEAILLLRAPEKWSDDPLVQQAVVHERAAREQGIAYDARLQAEVVADLQAQGIDAVPGFAASVIQDPAVAAAISQRRLLPLSNASNALVVECNEGRGYLQYRSDEFGFNNPAGLAAGPVDVAVIGESLALGHCVAPGTSTVDLLRERFPRTANFGVAGSRVLGQVGTFREYVRPLKPPVVVWFVHMNFAEPRHELDQPVLVRYLEDESFAQGLRERQHEVDAFVRELAVPAALRRDRALRRELDDPARYPLERVVKLAEIRNVVGLQAATQRPPAAPELSHFVRAVDLVAETAGRWGGRLLVVMLPSYELSVQQPQAMVRYRAVSDALETAAVDVVDGPAVFAEQPDFLSLYTLRTDNHPNARGHALLGRAVIAALDPKEKP